MSDARPSRLAAVIARLAAEARDVGGVRGAWRLVRRCAGALGALARGARLAELLPGKPSPGRIAPGLRIAALGPLARAALAAVPDIEARAGPGVELAVADTRADAAACSAPLVVLADRPALAVPAFDPTRHNPVGWTENVAVRGGALGPPRLLPPGVPARRVDPDDAAALRRCHHLIDTRAFHASELARAGTLARIAATGVPVHLADGGPGLGPLLGHALHALMRAPPTLGDADARERLSIAQRRLALTDHAAPARIRALRADAGLPAGPDPGLPTVSVLLPTRRPALLGHALANVARQDYPHLELVLALHGDGFGPGAPGDAARRLTAPARVLRLPASVPFGAVLNAAAAAASGELLAKMDDDDVYDPHHIHDLVLAHRYSGADLVGKGFEHAYLAHADVTIRCHRGRAESYSRNIAGGALLIAGRALERTGGWRPVGHAVDRALADDVLAAGGTVYRTHGFGFLLVRHGREHTWAVDDAELLARASAVHSGWRPDAAAIDPPIPPPFPGSR